MIDDAVVYLPMRPDRLPLLAALYIHEGMTEDEKSAAARVQVAALQQCAPFQLTGRLPEPNEGKTILYVCHSKQTLDEAISLARTRPLIVWAWLLDENLVAEAQMHVPVVFGPQNTIAAKQRLQDLQPSKPDPDAETDTSLCHAFEHGWVIPQLELDSQS